MNKLIHFLEDNYLNLISGLTGAIAWSLYKKQNIGLLSVVLFQEV